MELLNSVDHQSVVGSKDSCVITDEALEALLDRGFARHEQESSRSDNREDPRHSEVFKVLEEKDSNSGKVI